MTVRGLNSIDRADRTDRLNEEQILSPSLSQKLAREDFDFRFRLKRNGFQRLRPCHVNRASLTLSVGDLQALFQVVEVFAPERPFPLQSRPSLLPEQNGQSAVVADTVRNTHLDTSTGENDNDSRT